MTEDMDATLLLRDREAGTSRLLRHCLAPDPPKPRVPARERLNEAIGRDLARLLVRSLTAHGHR
jgi:hypothetical protein